MNSGKNVQWVYTRTALKNFMENFNCSKCNNIADTPIRYQKCSHLFCATCVGSKSQCPECETPAKRNEVHRDIIVAELINHTNVISQIINKSNSPIKKDDSRSSNFSVLEHDTSFRTQSIPKDINKRNHKGETRLHSACIKKQNRNIDAIRSLLEAGADPNTKDNNNWLPLHEVISFGYYDVAKLLLEAGANPDIPGYENCTALHEAVKRNDYKEVKLLLQFNADLNARDSSGKTPLDYASEDMRKILTNPQPADCIMERTFTNISNITSLANNTLTVSGTCVFGLNLSSESLMLLSQVVSKHKFKVSKTFSAAVTHVIVEPNDRFTTTPSNYEILLAILRGKWILSSQWIKYCMAHTDLNDLELDLFEISGTTSAPRSNTPARARENAQKQNPKLFNNCYFYFAMNNQSTYPLGQLEFTKSELAKLISEGEGTILNREPDPELIQEPQRIPFHVSRDIKHPLHRCSHYIIYVPQKDEPEMKYNMPHMKSLPLIWLIECIEQFELLDPAYIGITG